MADLKSSEGENNIEMNGHSLDAACSEAEQTKSTDTVIEKKVTTVGPRRKKLLRKMSNGEMCDDSDSVKDKISAIEEETEINIKNDTSEHSDVKNKTNDSVSDTIGKNNTDGSVSDSAEDSCDKSVTNSEETPDKSVTNSAEDKPDNVKDKTDESVVDTSDNDVKDIDVSEANSSAEIVEIHDVTSDKNSVNEQNGESRTKRKFLRKPATSKAKEDEEIVAETINDDDDESDIEMIEESDPLAISDVDVRLAREEKMKKDSSLIIIDTNTILKTASGLTVTGVKNIVKGPKPTKASAISTTQPSSMNVTASIQSALQAIATGTPGIQGLQSAYATAIQQALLNQANNTLPSPQYVNQLQQCYSSLGEIQDEAYVIEAPSFIVPYVMEGKPQETIKDYLEKIKNEETEEKAKLEKEKAKLEKAKHVEEKNQQEEKGKDENDDEVKNKDKSEHEAKNKDKSEHGAKSKDDKKDKDALSDVETNDKEESKAKDDKKNKNNKTRGKKSKTVEEEENAMKDDKEDKKAEAKEAQKQYEDEDYKPETQTDCELSENEDNAKNARKPEYDSEDKENSKSSSDEEDDDEDDADDDEVIALAKEEKRKEDLSHLGKWESFYQSTLGKFFLDIGLNQVEEFIQNDLVRMTKRKLRTKTVPSKQDMDALKILEYQLKRTREKNSHFNLELKTCRHCTFKTESELVMSKHLEAPHMINYTYRCNFCEFETRGPQSILFHMEAMHNVKGRLERAAAFFQCPLCPFEENTKSKMTRHSFSCVKRYKPEKNCDLVDWEPPAKIPKLQRGRANSRSHESLKMPGLFSKAFAGMNMTPGMLLAGGLPMSANSRGRGRPVGSYKNLMPLGKMPVGKNQTGTIIYPSTGAARFLNSFGGANAAHQLSIANQVMQSVSQGSATRLARVIPSSTCAIPNFGSSSSITIQSVNNKSGSTKLPQQPSISITPLVRGQSGKNGSTSKDGKPTYVVCEICDGYIKDLEQLRNHMNLIHKVKIHPKMIYNRPPLNCQKCQHRFFTDQGLERHLLGTHGLVTSSMQEAANRGKDSGRCPICGKVFQWKLLNHVSRDHKTTLKPAHLSYKCTVCTATFNMYRLFENHVYSAHSVVNKSKGGDSSSSNSKKSMDSPLKINDEITIIPQPASKSKSEAGKSFKSNDTPSVSKEITITKVGGPRPTKKSGVEIISLDDSPAKRQLDEPRRRSSAKRVKLSQ